MRIRIYFVVISLCLFASLVNCGSASTSSSQGSPSGGSSGDSSGGTLDTGASSLNFYLPYPNGQNFTVWQGNGGSYSHTDCYNYAWDFNLAEGDSIAAVAAGRVMATKEDSNTGGSSSDFQDDGNYIMIDHGLGYYSMYVHLCQNCVDVEPGDVVTQGQVIGQSGNTGWSTDPHLHFQINSWSTNCSVSVGFADVSATDGIPVLNGTYSSLNDGSSGDSYTPTNIAVDRYSDNGVVLDSGFSWVMTRGETLNLTGRVTNGKSKVALFLMDSNGTWLDGATVDVASDNTFSLSYTLSQALSSGMHYVALTTSDTSSFYTDFSDYAWVE